MPLNINVFTEANFLPAEVINCSDPVEQNHPDSTTDNPHPSSVHTSAPVLVDQPKASPNLPITPESIRPYPKARMQLGPCKEHKKGKIRILTDTLERQSLEVEAQAKLDKKTKKSVPNCKPDDSSRSKSLNSESLKKSNIYPLTRRLKMPFHIKICSSYIIWMMSLCTLEVSLNLRLTKRKNSRNFVLMRFMVGKKPNSAVYYVGEIDEVSGRLAKINYLCKSSEKFIFTECPNCAELILMI